MTVSTRSSNLGHCVFGLAALGFGLITLIWHDYKNWDQWHYLLNAANGPVFVYTAAAAQIFGGAAILLRAPKTGAAVLSTVYLVFTLLSIPPIVATPQIYNQWGNFFEQLSLMTGPAIIYASWSSAWSPQMLNRVGRILVGICAISFALEQAIYLDATAKLVPKWLPPGQKFWAITTTVLFALAALALLTNRMALLATRLLTVMILMFGLFVWIPLLLSNPHSHANWSESCETLAIAATAWILADLLDNGVPSKLECNRLVGS
jgi:hypothetical protein